jgi:hypothetical protein
VANYFQDPAENDFGGKRVANYFLDAAEHDFGGNEWQIIFRTGPNQILAGKGGKLFSGPGRT